MDLPVKKINYSYLNIPTGLYFELQNGEVEHFVINDRKAWLEELNKIIH